MTACHLLHLASCPQRRFALHSLQMQIGAVAVIARLCQIRICIIVLQSQRWVEDIASNWDFKRIIPAHFAAPVPATPRDLR